MKTLKTFFATGLLFVAMASGVHAQESRIAFINSQRITSESGPAKAATAKLESEFSSRQKELTVLQSGVKSTGEKLERDAPTLTDSQRLSRQKEFADQNRDFQRKKREFDEDLNGRRNEELQQVYEKATKAIKQLAETEKYDLVVQEAVYFNPKIDITDKVIKILNAGAK
jgi:outer membrane protein